MVLYFTGTGNSRHAARILAENLGDEIVDIFPYLKENKKGVFHSDRPFVFVLPTYGSYIPLVIEKFIEEADFSGDNAVYFLMTCGASASKPGIVKRVRPLCEKKGLDLMGVEEVVMPENYITLFFAPSKELADSIVKKAEKGLPELAKKISERERIGKKGRWTFSTYIVNPCFYKLLVKDKPYYATGACNGCGKCASVCPLNDIELVDKKPVWKGNCTQCMACISQCPTQAIEYGKKTKGKRRYYLS